MQVHREPRKLGYDWYAFAPYQSEWGDQPPNRSSRGLRCEEVNPCGAEPHTKGVGRLCSKVRFVGLDVHAETIAVAVAETGSSEVRSWGTIPNRLESVRKLIRKIGEGAKLKCCYEAGPTGYVLYWQLTQLGVDCEVIAPSLIPTKAGDRVKTDRRDAERLARCYRAGELTPVWVPDAAHEALRDLVRARAKQPSRISCAIATSWGSFCCVTASGRSMRDQRGVRSI